MFATDNIQPANAHQPVDLVPSRYAVQVGDIDAPVSYTHLTLPTNREV